MIDKNLLKLLGADKRYVIYIVVCNLMSTVCNVLFAFTISWIFHLVLTANYSEIHLPFVTLVAACGMRFLLSLLIGNFSASLGSGAKRMLRRRIYDKAARLGKRETDDLSLASLTQVAIEGVEQLDLYYTSYIPQFFYAVISPFILFIILMFISVPSALILIVCVPMIPMSIIAVSKYAKKIFATYWGKYTKMGDAFLDQISGMKELKVFGADGLYHDRMQEHAEEFRKITMKVLTMQLASTTIMDLVAYGGAGLGIALAVWTKGWINPIFNMSKPALILFIVLVAVDFFLPLRALGSAFHVSMNGATAGRKILTLLNAPEPEWGKEKVERYDIRMEHVNFSYDGERQILKDVSIEVAPREIVAVAGQSGSGKSTIIELLLGRRVPDSGRVLVGGKELKSLSREEYYRHVGVISYNTYLFNDSVRANFKLANPSIADEKIMQYLIKVNLDRFICENGGLDLVLNEDSINLSGGQRQRLALAIGLAADKDVYFFDEVTSNIDADSEKIIMKNIYLLSKEKTIIIISHRLKNLVNAARIYSLRDGQIETVGNHEDLIHQDGIYREMYERQEMLEEGYMDASDVQAGEEARS